MVKVSVVMPVYNASDYLRESVGCILNQTHEQQNVFYDCLVILIDMTLVRSF